MQHHRPHHDADHHNQLFIRRREDVVHRRPCAIRGRRTVLTWCGRGLDQQGRARCCALLGQLCQPERRDRARCQQVLQQVARGIALNADCLGRSTKASVQQRLQRAEPDARICVSSRAAATSMQRGPCSLAKAAMSTAAGGLPAALPLWPGFQPRPVIPPDPGPPRCSSVASNGMADGCASLARPSSARFLAAAGRRRGPPPRRFAPRHATGTQRFGMQRHATARNTRATARTELIATLAQHAQRPHKRGRVRCASTFHAWNPHHCRVRSLTRSPSMATILAAISSDLAARSLARLAALIRWSSSRR